MRSPGDLIDTGEDLIGDSGDGAASRWLGPWAEPTNRAPTLGPSARNGQHRGQPSRLARYGLRWHQDMGGPIYVAPAGCNRKVPKPNPGRRVLDASFEALVPLRRAATWTAGSVVNGPDMVASSLSPLDGVRKVCQSSSTLSALRPSDGASHFSVS
jgi:hypothetical protein